MVSSFFDVWLSSSLFLSPSLPPAVSVDYKNICETEKRHAHSQKKSKPPLTILHYTASTLVVFTDWRLFVVVGRYRSQRLFRRSCDWYHMKEVFVWPTEYRHYSEGYSGK